MADSEPGTDEGQDQAAAESAKPQARPDTLRDLARVLAGNDENDDETGSEGAASSDASATADGDGNGDEGQHEQRKPLPLPKTLDELAERLQVDASELYKLAVPTGVKDGETLTLGELKDAAKKRSELAVRELQFEEDRGKREAELMRAQAELEEIMQHLPKDALKGDKLKAAADIVSARAARERQRTLQVIPEWRDDATRERELAAMVEHLKGYGFPAQFLAQVNDHRTIRYIRENMRRQQRVESALKLVEQVHGKQPGTGKPQGKSGKKPAGNTQTTNAPNQKRSQLVNLMQPSEG